MTWSRFDDGWVERPVWESVSFEARWHYKCLIQYCSRTRRYDGRIPLSTALRCSDVPDPGECHGVLEAHSLIECRGDVVVLVEIDEHIPPPSVRENAEQSKIRMARMRKHRNGDHSDCLPEHCESPTVTGVVTRNTRTGQDRLSTPTTGVPVGESVTRNSDGDSHGGVTCSECGARIPPGAWYAQTGRHPGCRDFEAS